MNDQCSYASNNLDNRGGNLTVSHKERDCGSPANSVVGPLAGHAPLRKMGLSQKWHRNQTNQPHQSREAGGERTDDKTGKYRCAHRIVGLMSRPRARHTGRLRLALLDLDGPCEAE